jgi:hypothetical protein
VRLLLLLRPLPLLVERLLLALLRFRVD